MTTDTAAAAHRSPSTIDLDARMFAGVSNSSAGQVSGATRFRYRQDDTVIWADYDGGEIVRGFLVGTRNGERLHFRYVHLSVDGTAASGVCDSRIEVLCDGRIRLEESWAWESRPEKGTSVVEEIR
ncbi:hypothetical protein [Rhodococcus chondri]|uniref:N-acetylglutamate synthase n=1 Tax=Rhodococcus chondri TaxID=3065941 RepID=A0ABU7JY89_9NOCA|nr:hypothetical protein [Rhodococcus sp. CC-R104]MEE2034983.1 hypothetical protein [Rhodococcus sp. CC-R104]